MRILFLGINYPPEAIGIAVYSGGLCAGMAARGHDVRVVTAKPYYPAWKVFEGYRGGGWRHCIEDGAAIVRSPLYVPARPTGLKRLAHHISFAASAFGPMMKAVLGFKPDLVMVAAPSLASAPVALLAATLGGAKSWIHVQDFEVGAAVATGLLDERSRLVGLGVALERRLLTSFDVASSISAEMCKKLRGFGMAPDQVFELRNWAEIDAVQPLTRPSIYRDLWKITTPHVALYSGNIGHKQGLDTVIEAARLLQDRGDLTFIICGEGPNRPQLQALAAGLSNVQFHDLQPREQLNDLVGLATVHLLPQRADAADLVLPSKLTNMLASGRPIVAGAAPGTGLWREVDGCGIATSPEDAAGFAAAIGRLLDDPELYAHCAVSARSRALSDWDKEAILNRFEARATALISGESVAANEVEYG